MASERLWRTYQVARRLHTPLRALLMIGALQRERLRREATTAAAARLLRVPQSKGTAGGDWLLPLLFAPSSPSSLPPSAQPVSTSQCATPVRARLDAARAKAQADRERAAAEQEEDEQAVEHQQDGEEQDKVVVGEVAECGLDTAWAAVLAQDAATEGGGAVAVHAVVAQALAALPHAGQLLSGCSLAARSAIAELAAALPAAATSSPGAVPCNQQSLAHSPHSVPQAFRGESWFSDATVLRGGGRGGDGIVALDLSAVSHTASEVGAALHASMPAALHTPATATPLVAAPRTAAPWHIAPRMLQQQQFWSSFLDRARRSGVPARVAVTAARSGQVQRGELRFVGPISANRSVPLWLGVALDEGLGRHDGAVGGKRYFRCAENHGLFAKPGAVQLESEVLPL